MKFLLLLCFIFLCACASNPQKTYDSVSRPEKNRSLSHSADVLLQPLESDGGSFQFVANQMKKVVQDYQKMKDQLSQINTKLDQALNKLALYELKHLFPPKSASTPLEDEITIYLSNNEELLIKITKQEDYRQLIGQIILGDFDIDTQEQQRLLILLKNKVNPPTQDSLEQEPVPSQEEPLQNQNLSQHQLKTG